MNLTDLKWQFANITLHCAYAPKNCDYSKAFTKGQKKFAHHFIRL